MPVIVNTEFLQKRREELDLTQRDVAWRVTQLGLKLNDNHYSRIERGLEDYTNIKLETAFAIAYALHADLHDCFTVKYPVEIKKYTLSPDQKRKVRGESKQSIKFAIGMQLKGFRTKRKIPAREIAEAIDVHPSYVFQIEKGNASMEVIEKMARFYGFSLADLKEVVDDAPTDM